ncbi:MAG: DUF1552 domain-containing protein [Steroidobacteraceae bacterium]
MFVTKKHLSRRTVLRSLGATLSLPLLDAMIPAATAMAQTAATPRSRLSCIEIVHGSAGSTAHGTAKNLWSPAGVGRDWEFTEILSPLKDFREHLTIVSGTDLKGAMAWNHEEEGADHMRSSAAYLTAAHPRKTEGADIYNGISIDQRYAQKFGQDTPLPSIQLCMESADASGACDYGYACVYSDTISWSSPTTPLPMTLDPRIAFETLFGDGATPAERLRRQKVNASILDWISNDVHSLKRGLGTADSARMDDYLANVREIERRIQKIEKYNLSGEARALPAAPVGVPDDYEEHLKLMFDIQVLAFMTDTTRVASMKMSHDVNMRVFAKSGTATPFHSCSHHGETPSRVEEFAKINRYHVSLLPYFFEKLRSTPDGDGSLLDHSLVLYGSPLGDSNVHNHRRLPVILVGHASGAVRGGTHLRVADETPFANVLLTTLNKLGMGMPSLEDSTGELDI